MGEILILNIFHRQDVQNGIRFLVSIFRKIGKSFGKISNFTKGIS